MFLPPSYFVSFSIGGFLRLYTNHKDGKEWFAKKGQVIAVGFIAGAAVTLVIVSFLSPFLQLVILPIWLLVLGVILWRYRHDPEPEQEDATQVTAKQDTATQE